MRWCLLRGRQCDERRHPPQAHWAPLPPVSCSASLLASLGSTVHLGGLSASAWLFLSILRTRAFPPCQASPFPAEPPGGLRCSFLPTLVLLWLLKSQHLFLDQSEDLQMGASQRVARTPHPCLFCPHPSFLIPFGNVKPSQERGPCSCIFML